ncbi:MAG: CHAT domain-containing protein [Blastocatellia bacterium]
MPIVTRNSGLRVTVPSSYEISEIMSPRKRRGPRTRVSGAEGSASDPIATSLANEAIIEALEEQDLKLIDKVELTPAAAPPPGRRREPAPSGENIAELELDLGPPEDAVILLETEGMYSWQFAADSALVPADPGRRGVRQTPAQKRVTFRIEMPVTKHPGQPARRGIVQDFLADKVKAYVLKFAARIAVGQAIKFLERNVRRGIVRMDSLDPASWSLIDDLSSLNLPTDRPARILLFVHGTFSSTIGGYGALTGTPWGQKFLEGAWANYDAVIGFDHLTLSSDPLANATDLLNRLESINWNHAPHFDVVVHSRGGLVFRSLVELLMPLASWQAHFDRVIFTACTNAGTSLAEPDNWHTLIDLHTNLAVAACRLLGLLPHAKAVALVLKEVIQGLGAFVKYLATRAVTDGDIPGLAAMEPDGDFITKINEAQVGQPTIEKSYYCAITSEFEAQLFNGDHEPKELPRRLVQWIADSFTDKLMRESNDLVVNTASMTAIDPQVGNFIKDRLDFGKNPQVYHTNYFFQPRVVNALTNWLQLAQPAQAVPRRAVAAPSRKKRKSPRAKQTGASKSRLQRKEKVSNVDLSAFIRTSGRLVTPLGSVVGSALPATVDRDIIVTAADTSVKNCLKWIGESSPSYVVIHRDYRGSVLYYAYAAEEIFREAKKSKPATSLLDALDLHEIGRSSSQSTAGDVRPSAKTSGLVTARRTVVLDRGKPIGVVPEVSQPQSGAELATTARIAIKPRRGVESILASRAMPTFTVDDMATTRDIRVRKPLSLSRSSKASVIRVAKGKAQADPPKVTCYFHAEMDGEVVLKRATSVEVLVSREVIGRVTGAAAAAGSGEVDPSKKLMIQVFPKNNFEMAGDDRIEIDPPAPGDPQSLIFDLRPTHLGDGEVWVIARQGQVPLVTLVLKPAIVATKGAAAARATADAVTSEAPPLAEPINQLFILEQHNGNESSYRFQFQSPGLKLLEWDSSKVFVGNRKDYVDNLYQQIEKRWIANEADVQAFADEMREFGGDLLDELFPPKLQQILWDHRKDLKSIMVISDEPFIPWEIVHLKEPGKPLPAETRFLGQMGLVRWLHEAGWPPDKMQIRAGRARYVIPDYPDAGYVLPEATLEANFLSKKFGATAVEAKSAALRQLLRTAGEFDLLHFACHGQADQGNISNAGLLMQGRMESGQYITDLLTATTVEQNSVLKGPDDNRPLIVLNACQVGRAGYKLTGIGGFAQAFLKRDAGAFVGTLWSVGDSPARTFTETFYSELLKKSRIADATIKAREAARQAGDATWLAYVVYGNPQATISK